MDLQDFELQRAERGGRRAESREQRAESLGQREKCTTQITQIAQEG